MPPADAIARGQHAMTVCNACRYCEQYCPVFPAMERRLVFSPGDLAYLANLCHNCGECLYACQYAPPHKFAINVPQTMAQLRVESFRAHAWPRWAGTLLARQRPITAGVLSLAMAALVWALAVAGGASPAGWHGAPGDFYGVLPHEVLVGLFGAVGLFVLVALGMSGARFMVAIGPAPDVAAPGTAWATAIKAALTLEHLHGGGVDCVQAEESRTPWRRWFHHCTFYGFLLCLASTSVAALYHVGFGWIAPYPVFSLPVVLGVIGGIGLVAGPVGLLAQRGSRDHALTDQSQEALDRSFLLLLLLTALSGLALLAWRGSGAMAIWLALHLGSVLALFITLPYGKFVHGFYRVVALARHAFEQAPASPTHGRAD